MAVTDQSGLVPRRRADDDAAPAAEDEPREPVEGAVAEVRPRTASGHCCDGLPCDHPDHGTTGAEGGVIHFIF